MTVKCGSKFYIGFPHMDGYECMFQYFAYVVHLVHEIYVKLIHEIHPRSLNVQVNEVSGCLKGSSHAKCETVIIGAFNMDG